LKTSRSERITVATARRLALAAQLLDGRAAPPPGRAGVAAAVEHLGYVQIDTIAVVERAHHHTLWSRCPDYAPAFLDTLLRDDHRVFEYWGHAASYLPINDYRFYRRKMLAFPWDDGWTRRLYETHQDAMAAVYDRIAKEGPLSSTDFEAPPGKKRGTWWDWKPAKTALELLLWQGRLMVAARDNFRRVYDLAEKVLPAGIDTQPAAADETARFLIRRAVRAHAVVNRRDFKKHIRGFGDLDLGRELETLVAAGEIVVVTIKDVPGEPYYAAAAALGAAGSRRPLPRLHLLSPFDNLVIDRDRLRALFGFDYQLECYTPPGKRRHGYFCLPLLWRGAFVGRLDPKADRKAKTLIVRRLDLEADFQADDAFVEALAAKLRAYAAFNNCDRVVIETASPGKLKTALARRLKT